MNAECSYARARLCVCLCLCAFCLSEGVLRACVLSLLRVLKISGRFETCLSLGAFISSGCCCSNTSL